MMETKGKTFKEIFLSDNARWIILSILILLSLGGAFFAIILTTYNPKLDGNLLGGFDPSLIGILTGTLTLIGIVLAIDAVLNASNDTDNEADVTKAKDDTILDWDIVDDDLLYDKLDTYNDDKIKIEKDYKKKYIIKNLKIKKPRYKRDSKRYKKIENTINELEKDGAEVSINFKPIDVKNLSMQYTVGDNYSPDNSSISDNTKMVAIVISIIKTIVTKPAIASFTGISIFILFKNLDWAKALAMLLIYSLFQLFSYITLYRKVRITRRKKIMSVYRNKRKIYNELKKIEIKGE